MAKLPEFKPNFKYSNVGTVIGKIVYVSDLVSKAGKQYGKKFLVSVKGHGSADVKIPSVQKAEQIANMFPVGSEKPVRFGLVTVDSYQSKTGKVYTNFTTFAEPSNINDSGTEVAPKIKGKVGGEVAKIIEKDGKIAFWLVSYRVDKEGKQLKNRNGEYLPPILVKIELVDKEIIEQFNDEVQEGSNVEVGYSYINKDDISFDEFGMPLGSGEKVSRIEGKRIIVHAGKKEPKPKDDFDFDSFSAAFGGIEIDDSEIPF